MFSTNNLDLIFKLDRNSLVLNMKMVWNKVLPMRLKNGLNKLKIDFISSKSHLLMIDSIDSDFEQS